MKINGRRAKQIHRTPTSRRRNKTTTATQNRDERHSKTEMYWKEMARMKTNKQATEMEFSVSFSALFFVVKGNFFRAYIFHVRFDFGFVWRVVVCWCCCFFFSSNCVFVRFAFWFLILAICAMQRWNRVLRSFLFSSCWFFRMFFFFFIYVCVCVCFCI